MKYTVIARVFTREGLKRQRTECPSPPDNSVEWTTPDSNEWGLVTIVQYLVEDVLSTEWEHRHGAAIGLRSVFRTPSEFLPHCKI